MATIQERLRSIDEETMYAFPASVHFACNTAATHIDALEKRVKELEVALTNAHGWYDVNRPNWGPGTLPTWFVDAGKLLNGETK